jgi:diguanylate cyclase (GGDEF)-like protein/PAS domain S-box-containing protein
MKEDYGIDNNKNQLLALERELDLYKSSITAAKVGIWQWNAQTGQQSINERWAEIIGYTIEELSPISIETWRNLLHPHDLILADKELEEVFNKTNAHYVLEFRMKHKNGEWIWIESNGAITSWTPEGLPLLINGSHIDITKRKMAEAALKNSERRLNASQEIAHIGNWEIDLETKEVSASIEAFKIYGIERISEKLALSEIQKVVKDEYRATLDEALRNLIQKNEKYDLTFEIKTRDTHEAAVIHSLARVECDDLGKPVRVLGTIRDVTAEKRSHYELISSKEQLEAAFQQLKALDEVMAEQNRMLTAGRELLMKSQARNRAIINVLPDVFFVYNEKGTFLDCQMNDVEAPLLISDDFIGKNLQDIMPRDIAEKGISCIKETLETGALTKFEYQLEIENEVKYFETRMVKSNNNEVLAIVRDITFEKKEKDYILKLSMTDYLTGLYNRRYFEQEIERLDSIEHLPLAIIMVDVNGLKLTNDAFGHLKGDEILKVVAGSLRELCPEAGFTARVGGDEFVIVCPNCARETADSIVQRIYQDVNILKIDNIQISVSAGCDVRLSLEYPTTDTFIKAENQMFRKKLVEGQSMRNQTIKAIMQTLNEKSEREKRHSFEVSKWSRKIGEAMSLSPQEIKELEMAGLLHDIGKIAVNEDILNKPGALTEEEYSEIKRHPESSYQILKSVDLYSPLAEYVLLHHERFDGKGYPRGIKGKEIPLVSRIISVADAFEAMIADRPYRKGTSIEKALDEIIHNSATQFDPLVVENFIKLFPERTN